MMRLIDADALMKAIRAHDYPLRAHFNSTDNGMFTIGIQQAVDDYFKRATDYPVKTSLYDEQERHENCTVEIWRNSLTGEVSIGWWKNGEGE